MRDETSNGGDGTPMPQITICIDCKHHRGGDKTAIWYDHYCSHPDHSRPLGVDPVTGVHGYMAKNDLGMTYFTNQESPYCRDYNDGTCKRFVQLGAVQRAVRSVL